MYFEEQTIDDLMRKVLTELLKGPFDVKPRRSNNGENPTSEILGASLLLRNPRARLSLSETRGKLFSALGEFLWYLSKGCDLTFIKYYIPHYEDYNDVNEKGMIKAGYGPRLFNFREQHDQVQNIIKLLKEHPFSRRAVIQIFDADDMKYPDMPCTCTLQFFLRSQKLHMVTYMRSNDAYKGLTHDVFAFTMLQEVIASSLSVDLGEYYHSVGSLHLYHDDIKHVEKYFKEGYQSTSSKFSMPPMPSASLWEQIEKFMKVEAIIRQGSNASLHELNHYWADLGRLLLIFSCYNKDDNDGIQAIRNQMISSNYHIAIDTKLG